MESANRQEIINVATSFFRKKGYSATGVGEIVKACGVTKGALYYYFSSKEELAFEVIKQVKEYFDEEIFVLATQKDKNAVLRLEQFNSKIEAFFSTHEDGCLLANLTLELGASYEVFKAEILDYFQKWEHCYYMFFSEYFTEKQARTLATDTLANVQGCILMYRASGDLSMLKRQHQHVVKSCCKN